MNGWGQVPGRLTLHHVGEDSDIAMCGTSVPRATRIWAPAGQLVGPRGRIVGTGCGRCNAAILRSVYRRVAADKGECECAEGPIHARRSLKQLASLAAVEVHGSRREAAAALNISLNALRSHLARLYCSLGVTNQVDARARLVSTEPAQGGTE